METTLIKSALSPNGMKGEVRQLRETARRISSSKKSAIRFLASTKMYTAKGRLKPQFS